MKFSYPWLRELAKFKETPEALAEFLTLRAFEVESVEKKGGDWVLDVKLIPNRAADAAGHAGLAREIATLKGIRYQVSSIKLHENERKAGYVLEVKIENPDDCPRYTARVIEGVRVAPSPQWLRERLETCGIQSINNIVDASNYVMLELGQPTHVFDYERLKTRNPKPETRNKPKTKNQKPKTIVVRRARSGEKLAALDDKTYPLSPEVLVIADEKEPIAIAGIKGGEASGVSAKTKTLVLESANFDPVRTRIASQFLNLKTDASYRFERGMDPNETARAVDRLAELIVGIAGGEVLCGRVDAYPRPLKQSAILFRGEYANRMIGTDLPSKFYEGCWKRLGWEYAKKGGADFAVKPPTIRRDIQNEEDLIEEVTRLYGYENITSKAPATALAPASSGEERQWERTVEDILAGAGFTEAYAYAFTGESLLAAFDEDGGGLLELENPTSPETRYLAAHPAQRYIQFTAENLRREREVRLFGIMKGFRPARAGSASAAPSSQETPADERKYLVLAAASKESKTDSETFYELKGTAERLLESLGIAEHWFDDALTKDEQRKAKALHPYRMAKIMADGEALGVIAELHPAALERLKAKTRIVFAEIDFEKLWKHARSEAEYRPAGRFPAVVRDIAVIVPEDAKADDVEGVIENAGGEFLVDSDLFDYFQDEAMAERGEKSLAFHLIFQSPERTLTDAEITRVFRKIVDALKAKDWEVRE